MKLEHSQRYWKIYLPTSQPLLVFKFLLSKCKHRHTVTLYPIMRNLEESSLISYARSSELSCEVIGMLVSGLKSIIRFALKSKVPVDVILTDLKRMNVPDTLALEFAKKFGIHRKSLESQIYREKSLTRFSKLTNLRWRVDIIISSGSLTRVMRPTVMLQVIISAFIHHTCTFLTRIRGICTHQAVCIKRQNR